MAKKFTPAEIAEQFERPMQSGEVARLVDAFWPTIKAALLAYDAKAVAPRRLAD